jgi:hypothetical protein
MIKNFINLCMLADDITLQVTSSSVRLVSSTSRDLKHEWHAPAGNSINVATANATQVWFI